MTRVAAIDCGTNSIRLLVADIDGDQTRELTRQMRIVRLGQDVDRTGRLAPAAIERARAALVEYTATIGNLGVEAVRMVATSATRDAANRDEFTGMVRDVLGVEPEVVTGQQEAALSFAGAAAGLPGVAEPMLVADVGGGSTELVLGDTGGVRGSVSIDVGSVRLTERHIRSDPPIRDEQQALVADARAALRQAPIPLDRAESVVGVAGTVTTLAALALDLPRYDSSRIHGARLPAATVVELIERLATMTHEQRVALPVMHPGRADVIVAGGLIVRVVLEASGASELIVSEHDILDGIAASIVTPSR